MSSTLPNSTPHMLHVPSQVTIERADSRHIVHRSGLKRLGYTTQQRAQLRAIQQELQEYIHLEEKQAFNDMLND